MIRSPLSKAELFGNQSGIGFDVLSEIDTGILLIDSTQHIVFANKAWIETSIPIPESNFEPGSPFEAIVRAAGEQGVYGPDNIEEQIKKRMGRVLRGESYEFTRETRPGLFVTVKGRPLLGGGYGYLRVDVTESHVKVKEQEEKINNLESILALRSLDLIAQGISVFDRDLKLVTSNAKFCELLEFPLKFGKAGTSIEEMFCFNADRGEYGEGDPKEQVRQRIELAQKFQPHEFDRTRPDGKTIHVLGKPILEGVGGFISVYTDVTEERQRERESEQRIKELENRMGLDTLDHVDIGIALIDKDLKVVRFNPPATSLYDLPASLTQSGQPFESVLQYLAGLGTYGEGEPDQVVKNIVKSLGKDWSHWQGDLNLPNGKIIDVTTHKLAGGGLCYLSRDVTEERQRQMRLEQTDPLSGLPNFERMEQLATEMIQVAEQEQKEMIGMRLKLDRFQMFNEVYGVNLGDDVFKAVVERVKLAIASDVVMGRGQGNELILMKMSVDARAAGDELAANLRDTMKESFHVDDKENVLDMVFTFSAGLACYPKDGADLGTLARKSGLALQYAAEEGDNYYYFDWRAARRRQTGQRLQLENELRIGIQESQFSLHYQPQIDLQTGQLIGSEALIRWTRSNGDLVSPAEFIPIAEESGLIIPIGRWVLDEACRQAKAWQDSGHSALKVSVNVSTIQFRQPDLVEQVRETLDKTGLAPEWLELEVTESIVAEDIERVIKTLEELRALGVSIAIDDFGTGYSSLSYLTRLPFDRLKIDQSFVRNVDRQNWLIVKSVVQLARSLGLEIIAEGVETLESMRLLRDIGCHIAQGYYFSRPVAPTEFEELFSQASVVDSADFPMLAMDRIRLGLPTDCALSFLNNQLDSYRQNNPEQKFTIHCESSERLIESLDFGELDAVVAIVRDSNDALLQGSWDVQPIWVCGEGLQMNYSDAVPLVLRPEGCRYRRRIVRALSEAGRDWYIAFQSPEIAALQDAVEKGLGVTALMLPSKSERMNVLESVDGFPRLERIRVGIYLSDKAGGDKSTHVLNYLRASLERSSMIDF